MDEPDLLRTDYLRDRKICATGRLVSLSRSELEQLVKSGGGTFLSFPRRTGFVLVVGDGGWPSETDGSVGRVFNRARRLKACGYAVDVIGEHEFLDRMGLSRLTGSLGGKHTLGELSQILDISVVRLRRWMRLGLIRPASLTHQIPYFDFQQVVLIRRLQELVEGGASLSVIGRALLQAKELLPHGAALDASWSNIERDGRVLLRQQDWVIDHTGQQYFDFEPADEAGAALYATAVEDGFHELCDQGLALEEEGRLEDAAETYLRALQLNADHPTLHFDLGNVLFQLGKREEAIERFLIATRLDADFAMAWHNLGSVYAQRGDWKNAETALRQSLSLAPKYADSHFTLAQVLARVGKPGEAAVHHEAYARHSRVCEFTSLRNQLLRVVHAES
jgi:tetratricopeptide (TPR) repeat protein